MEKNSTSKLILLLLLATIINTQDYFAGLNIDPTLISQANIAITTLKNSLYLNFNCNPSDVAILTPLSSSLPVDSSFLSAADNGFSTFQYQGFNSLGQTFTASPPQIICKYGTQRRAIIFTIYQQIITVTTLLQTIKSYLLEYNNIVIGNNNTVIGNDDFVIGSNNSIVGNNDWVFASNYQSTDPQNGVLIIELYLIELANIPQIMSNPLTVIHCIEQSESNLQFKNFWGKVPKDHRFSF